MTKKLVIPGKLPNLNDYSNAERRHRQGGARMKNQVESEIGWHIKKQLRGVKYSKPVYMAYKWVEPNRCRDKDNVAFAKKFIQDALVKSGVLRNDGWNEVIGFSDSFDVDKKNPRVEVVIIDEV